MQRMSYSFIRQGSKVEVSSEEDGYQNAWFTATVLQPPTPRARAKRHNEAVVMYDHMLSDDTGEPLVEKVKVGLIRPIPPEDDDPPTAFEPYDVVDVFYNEVWWIGYVVGLSDDIYTVAFESPPDVLEVQRSELRPHWDWVAHCHWVRPTKQTKSTSVFSPAVQVEIDPTEDNPGATWLPAVYLGEVKSEGFHMVKYKSSDDDRVNGFQKMQVQIGRIRPCPPKVENKDFNLLEKVDALFSSGWNVGVITKLLVGKRYTVSFKHLNKEVEFDYSEIRPHLDWIDGKWVSKSKRLVFNSCNQEQLMHKCDKEESIGIISLDGNSSLLNDRMPSTSTPDDTNVEQQNVPKCPNEEQVNDTSSNEKRTLSREEVGENDQGKISAERRETASKSQFGMYSWLRTRKRSRLSESKFQKSQSSATGANDVAVMPCSELEEVDKQILEFLNDDVIEEAADKRTSEPAMQDLPEPNDAFEPNMDDGTIRAGNSEFSEPNDALEPIMDDGTIRAGNSKSSELNDALEGSETSGTAVGSEDVMEADAEVDEHDDTPTQNLQAQMETDGTSKAVFGVEDYTTEKQEAPIPACSKLTDNGVSEAVDSIEDCTIEKLEMLVSKSPKLTGSQAQGSPESTHVSTDGQLNTEETSSPKNANESGETEVPFVVKWHQVWKFIESMEVFRKLPQSPHFRPLLKYDKNKREALAIGHMVNYTNLMVEISALQPIDSTEHIDSLIKPLAEYADMGFDVKVVQGRLNAWRNTKAEIEKLKAERKGITSVIKERIEEKARIDEEVVVIKHRILELGRKREALAQLRMERRAKLVRSALEAEAVRIDLESARERSRNLLAALIPW